MFILEIFLFSKCIGIISRRPVLLRAGRADKSVPPCMMYRKYAIFQSFDIISEIVPLR